MSIQSGTFQLAVYKQEHAWEGKTFIRKHIEWPPFWHINQEHSVKVCKDVVKRKDKTNESMVIGLLLPLSMDEEWNNRYLHKYG